MEISDSVSWEEAFSHHDADNEPGNCLRRARCKEGTQIRPCSSHQTMMESGLKDFVKIKEYFSSFNL